jgi:predicted phage baseplate assembly protein
MSIPEPILDDLRFQKDLVDEARRRIVRYSPDWTDYNVSDPGITLIELFAWMTELITYRLNRVPEKNYARFLDLLGVRLRPARSATTEVTFRLAVPFPVNDEDHSISTTVPRGYEISARQAENEPEVIFTTDEPLQIGCPILSYLRREQEFNRDFLARLSIEPFQVFNPQPLTGDTFYMGFDPDQRSPAITQAGL